MFYQKVVNSSYKNKRNSAREDHYYCVEGEHACIKIAKLKNFFLSPSPMIRRVEVEDSFVVNKERIQTIED